MTDHGEGTFLGGTGGLNAPQVDELLARLRHQIDSARPMPLSASSMINREETLVLLDDIMARLPEELREARWLLKERDEFRAQLRREGDEIIQASRARAEQMVQRTEVVKAAETRARKIIEKADADARRLRLEAEDYCDQKLGSFENVLRRTLNQVEAGRAKLQGDPMDDLARATGQVDISSMPGPPPAAVPYMAPPPASSQVQAVPDDPGFFDQDHR